MRSALASAVVVSLLLASASAAAETRTVGPGKTYAKPCDAIKAAQPGDLVEVDASGDYAGDHCVWSTDNLTVRGVGGRAKIDGAKDPANIAAEKAIFAITAPNATLENFELSGAKSTSSANGAGIRHEGANLTIRNCYFHDDEDGILGTPAHDDGEVLIEGSEFADNGVGDGLSHNMYLNHYAKFTLRYSYTHGASVGHLVKSRARENHILYNRITDEAGTTASYEVNLPNAGLSFVIGNVIEQSATTENPAIIDYGSEPSGMNADHHLFVVNNTIVNTKGAGTFVQNAMTEPAVITNNVFAGGGKVTSQPSAVLTTNFTSDLGDAKLVSAGTYDYHLLADSPCIGAGTDPGTGSGQSLVPAFEYVHPLGAKPRTSVGGIDIGAYEFGNPGTVADGGAPPSAGADAGQPPSSGPSNDGGAESPASDADSGCGCRVHARPVAFGRLGAVLALCLAGLRHRGRRREMH